MTYLRGYIEHYHATYAGDLPVLEDHISSEDLRAARVGLAREVVILSGDAIRELLSKHPLWVATTHEGLELATLADPRPLLPPLPRSGPAPSSGWPLFGRPKAPPAARGIERVKALPPAVATPSPVVSPPPQREEPPPTERPRPSDQLTWHVWGPVSSVLANRYRPGARLHQCQGGVPQNCRRVARTYKGAHADVIVAFSNGGSAVKELMTNSAAIARVKAILLLDATYTTAKLEGKPDPSQELINVTMAAALKDGYVWATGSPSPNGSDPSAAATLEALAYFSGLPEIDPSTTPAPRGVTKAWARGSALLVAYSGVYTHREHATILGPIYAEALHRRLA